MNTITLYIGAAAAEIGGCFAFWMWLRLDQSPLWGILGLVSLTVFAVLLTRSDVAFAGRAYAAYGGVYILASLLWLWTVEKTAPDLWDMVGAGCCLVGAAIILWAPRVA